jgi:putative glutamine amidotransferase
MTRPLIAIPAYRVEAGKIHGWKQSAVAVPEPYLLAVVRAGGIPLTVGTLDAAAVPELLRRVDGLLLIGGGDLDPASYGQERHPNTYGVDPERDEREFALLREAMDGALPTFAICRGQQVVNVALGGTLLQHLPEIDGVAEHGVPGPAGHPVMHDVKLAAGSRVAGAAGAETLACSSHHHQAVDRLGDGLTASAWSDDGLIEAIETADGTVVAVQWHPEETAGEDSAQQAVFDAFVRRARGA